MLRTIYGNIKPRWKQVLSCLLAVIVIAGLLPEAFAVEAPQAASTTASVRSVSVYPVTGDFEVNIAGATGWNGTRLPLPVYDAETGGKQILTVPASDGASPVPFALLEYSGGSRVKIGLATGSDGSVTSWEGGKFSKIGWVSKEHIFVNLPDVVPSIAYHLTNSTGSIFRVVDGTELPNVTGKQFYQAKKQFSSRLSRYEFIVPCMFTLAERLAAVQETAMANGETLVVYETFRPAAVQAAVRDSFGELWDSNSTVAADMNKAIAMGYARNQGWFISNGTSNHQAGLAVDMSLAKGDPAELHEYTLGGVTYQKYEAWTEYKMPTPMHQLSSAAIRYKAPVSSWSMPMALENWTDQFAASEGAKKLQHYCTDAGLIPLASEWWHFNAPNVAKIMARGSYAGQSAVNTKGNYSIDRAYSVVPYTALTELSGVNTISSPVMTIASSSGDTGGLNPGSAGGQKPSTSNVAWSTDPKRTFIRFSLIELPRGAETDLSVSGSWRLVGHPINIVWGKGTYETWDAAQCRSNVRWYNSNAMQFNEKGSNAPQLMAGTVYAYDATVGNNQRWVTTADEFQQETGITDQQKERMFDLNSPSWSSGWVNGDYTSMWGTDPHPVTDGNLYSIYKANDAFVYLLSRLSETAGAGSGWSKEEALAKWSEFTYDSSGELRTKYRVIIETGGIFEDPDGVRRAYTLREMMAYSIYNNEPVQRNSLIWDQTSTIKNMAQWMRQSVDNQFIEYPLDETGVPDGTELHSTNGFRETNSYVDSISSPVKIRDTIFSERRSYGIHILNPFNFESPQPSQPSLEVTKRVQGSASPSETWDFTVTYTVGTPSSFTATRNGADCTREITDNGTGLKFSLMGGDTIRIVFEADESFRFEVRENDTSQLTGITGIGGTADLAGKKFTSSGGTSKVIFTNGEPTEEPSPTPGSATPSLRLIKSSADGTPLEGVTFRIAPIEDGSHSLDRTTAANGEIVIEGLEPGIYSVREVTTVPDHILDPTEHHVQLSPGQATELRLSNDKRPNLTIHKSDADTGDPISDTVFLVKSADGHSIQEVKTGPDGTAVVENLLPGVYEISEKSVPSPYLLDAPSQLVTLYPNQDREVYVEDHKAPCIEIIKENSITHDRLSNVRFQVWYASSSTETGEYNDLGVFTTDESGRIVLTEPQVLMRDGWYRIKELEPLKGFGIKDSDTQEAFIPAGKSHTFRFENTPLSALVAYKYDSVSKAGIENCLFELRYLGGDVSGSGGTVIGRYRTTSNGSFTVSGLKAGYYICQEVESDGNHVIDCAPQSFYISGKDQDVITLYFSNSPKGSVLVKKVSASDNTPLSDVEFLVTTSDGTVVGNANGKFVTDSSGSFLVENIDPGVTLVIKETRAKPGYLLDDTPQIVQVKAGVTVVLEYRNQPTGGLIVHKLSSTDKTPLEGVQFKITYADGSYVDAEGGKLSSNGLYWTNTEGQIVLDGITGTLIVTEVQSVPGFTIDPNTQSQTVVINPGDTQELYFYNDPVGGIELIKVSEADKSKRISNVTFEIRKMDDALVDTITTDKTGRAFLNLEDGAYYAVEVEAPKEFKVDPTPIYFEIKGGKTITKTVTNKPFSGILLHKTDSVTGEGIYDVKFLVYDANKNPIGEYTTDNRGYIYIDELTVQGKGKLFIRELEAAPGYELDKEYKTVYIEPGETIEIEWKNTPITGQIQVYKYAAEYNEVTGTAAGTLLPGAVFEIIEQRSGKVVDYITSDARGVAASRPLPLTRYLIREVMAPAYWQVDPTVHDVTLEYPGQIIKVSAYDKPAKLGVSVTKRGNASVLAGSSMRYDFTLANTSNVDLESFYFHDRIPTDIARATVLTTGTYSARLNYRILYKTNYTASYQVLASNLLTSNNYSFSLNAIPMQAGEYVTDIYFDFGKVPVGFQSVQGPTLNVVVNGTAVNGYQMVNRADVGGKYQGTWQTAQASWVTIIIKLWNNPDLPKTGY